MRSSVGMGLVLAVAAFGTVVVSQAQEELTRRDSRGPVTVAVTLTAPPALGVPVKARVVLDTHSVGLDAIALDQAVVIRTADGADVGPTAVEQAKGAGHHREAVLVFPPPTSAGPLRLVVRNVGGVAERAFVWQTPPAP